MESKILRFLFVAYLVPAKPAGHETIENAKAYGFVIVNGAPLPPNKPAIKQGKIVSTFYNV